MNSTISRWRFALRTTDMLWGLVLLAAIYPIISSQTLAILPLAGSEPSTLTLSLIVASGLTVFPIYLFKTETMGLWGGYTSSSTFALTKAAPVMMLRGSTTQFLRKDITMEAPCG